MITCGGEIATDTRRASCDSVGVRAEVFCGQYVLAVCTDETSVDLLAAIVLMDSRPVHSVIERLNSGVGFCICLAESTKVQCSSPCSIVVFSLERFRGVVRQQLLNCLCEEV